MIRPASARAVRSQKRTSARRHTAHVEYQPPGRGRNGRRIREQYHAITDLAVTVGFLTRSPGDALCGSRGPWTDIPDGLFPPLVTCRACQHITTAHYIKITGTMP